MKIILRTLLLLILLPLAHSADARMCTCSNAAQMKPYQDCVSDAQKKNESKCGLEARRAAVAAAETAISVRCNYESACTSRGITALMNGNPLISFTDENGRTRTQTFNEIVGGVLNNPNSAQSICFKNSQDASLRQCDIDPGQVACIPDSSCNDGNSRSFSSRAAVPVEQPSSRAGSFVSALFNFIRSAPAVISAPVPAYIPTQQVRPTIIPLDIPTTQKNPATIPCVSTQSGSNKNAAGWALTRSYFFEGSACCLDPNDSRCIPTTAC